MTTVEQESTTPMWQQVNYKPEKGAILPAEYATYVLNVELFSKALQSGNIELPNLNNGFSVYFIKRSATMSQALQEKYPNIRSYEGQEAHQDQNQVRIDQKNDSFKIAILASWGSYFIQELETPGIYYFYNKADLPENTGLINE